MSEQRRSTRPVGSSCSGRRRWLIGAVGALGASGLILGGVGVPVSADDVTAAAQPYASVEAQGGCLAVAAGTGQADGSAVPQQGTDGGQLEAAGEGTVTTSVCRDDLGDPPADDPGDSVTDDLDGIVTGALDDIEPGDLDDVVPAEPGGSLEGEVVGVVTAALDDGPPGGGDGSFPGGLVPDGSGIDADGLFDQIGQDPGAPGGGSPGGAGVGGGPGTNVPSANTSTSGSVSAPVAVAGAAAERDGPTDVVPGVEVGGGAPALVGTSVSPGAMLPRTGGGLGNGALRLVAALGFGRALVGLASRRRSALRD